MAGHAYAQRRRGIARARRRRQVQPTRAHGLRLAARGRWPHGPLRPVLTRNTHTHTARPLSLPLLPPGKYTLPLAIILTAVTTATVVLAGGAAAVKARQVAAGAPAPAAASPRAGGGRAAVTSSPPYRMLVIGDWGRRGVLNQTAVARAMASRAAAAAEAGSPVAVIISTGDNFYPW